MFRDDGILTSASEVLNFVLVVFYHVWSALMSGEADMSIISELRWLQNGMLLIVSTCKLK